MAALLSTRSLGVGNGLGKRVEDMTIVEISATQVPQPAQTDYQDRNGRPQWLIVSPYLEPEHLLDLRTLDTPNRLLALALTTLTPATTEYATVKYVDAFDWASLMSSLRSLAKSEGYRWTNQEFYVVEFRSRLKADIDVDLLFKLDKFAHEEATQAGNLLKYWYGAPSNERRNLATCKLSRVDRGIPLTHLQVFGDARRMRFLEGKDPGISKHVVSSQQCMSRLMLRVYV